MSWRMKGDRRGVRQDGMPYMRQRIALRGYGIRMAGNLHPLWDPLDMDTRALGRARANSRAEQPDERECEGVA